MSISRKILCLGLFFGVMLLAGCAILLPPAATLQERAALAPTGKLRVGVYLGSPTSLVMDASGNKVGVAYELGRDFARWLNVPFEPVEYRGISDVVEAVNKGQVDFTFTLVTPSRKSSMNLSQSMLQLEMGYLVPVGSQFQNANEIDRAGVKVGVVQGGTTQGILMSTYKQASVLPLPTLKVAFEGLAQGKLDVFTANKGILFQLSDKLPGARVLEGRWGLENLAIGIPKGREMGMPYVNRFAESVRLDGSLLAAINRAGLRGAVEP